MADWHQNPTQACEESKDKTIKGIADFVTPHVVEVLGAEATIDDRRTNGFIKQFLWPYAQALLLLSVGAVNMPDEQTIRRTREYRDVSSRRCLEDRLAYCRSYMEFLR